MKTWRSLLLLALVRVNVRVECDALHQVSLLLQMIHVAHIRFCALKWEANLILDQLERLAFVGIWLEDEQSEEVAVVEVLLEGLLVG